LLYREEPELNLFVDPDPDLELFNFLPIRIGIQNYHPDHSRIGNEHTKGQKFDSWKEVDKIYSAEESAYSEAFRIPERANSEAQNGTEFCRKHYFTKRPK
jgi:hypothetical protein